MTVSWVQPVPVDGSKTDDEIYRKEKIKNKDKPFSCFHYSISFSNWYLGESIE